MAAAAPPGDAALAEGLARWLAAHRGLAHPVVGNLSRPSAGYSSETVLADLTWTDGSDEAQVMPVTVWVVGLPAASFSVKVRLNGAAPGQARLTQVEVLTAPTATHEGVADEPSVTQRLLCPLPSELANPAASLEVVWAQALMVPPTTNCPAVGLFTAIVGGVVSTVKVLFADVPVIPLAFLQVATTS